MLMFKRQIPAHACVFALTATLLVGCDEPPREEKEAYVSEAPVDAYGLRGSDNSWPKVGADAATAAPDEMLRSNYLILFDGSGSMAETGCSTQGTRMDTAKRAVLDFMESVPDNANIGLFAFDKAGVGPRLQLAPHSDQRVRTAIDQLVAGGKTPLKDALSVSAKMLTQQAGNQLGYGEYHLVIVTDGLPSEGQDPTGVVRDIAQQSAISIHTIGFCMDSRHPLNQAGITAYYSAEDEAGLKRGLSAVLAEAPNFDVDAFAGDGNG